MTALRGIGVHGGMVGFDLRVNGTEFCSKAVDGGAYRKKVKLEFIRPSRPVENGFIESFNGRLRDE